MWSVTLNQGSSISFHRGPNLVNNTKPKATDRNVTTKMFAPIIIVVAAAAAAVFVFIVVFC